MAAPAAGGGGVVITGAGVSASVGATPADGREGPVGTRGISAPQPGHTATPSATAEAQAGQLGISGPGPSGARLGATTETARGCYHGAGSVPDPTCHRRPARRR